MMGQRSRLRSRFAPRVKNCRANRRRRNIVLFAEPCAKARWGRGQGSRVRFVGKGGDGSGIDVHDVDGRCSRRVVKGSMVGVDDQVTVGESDHEG
jgi:hypothetical protein